MATVPQVSRLADWPLGLYNLSTGANIVIDPDEVLTFSGETIAGANGQRLTSASLDAIAGSRADPGYLRSKLGWTGWYLFHALPYQDTDEALWGLLLKADVKYGNPSRVHLNIGAAETMLNWRIVEDGSGEGIALGAVAATDAVKAIVRTSTTGTDVDGNSRAWSFGSLAVVADTGSGTALPAGYVEKAGGKVGDVIQALAEKYGLVYELVPSWSGAAWTFTFDCKLAGGTDRTTGAGRVVISDWGNEVPEGERYYDLSNIVTVAYVDDTSGTSKDDGRIAVYGRIESSTKDQTSVQAAVTLANTDQKTGSVWKLNTALMGNSLWMSKWWAGDTVVRISTELGLAESNEIIAGVQYEFGADRILRPAIRWGDKKPVASNQKPDSPHSGGGGGGGSGPPIYGETADISFVASANASGIADLHTRADHAHKFALVVGALGEIVPASGVITFQVGTGLAATKVDADTFSLAADPANIDHGGLAGLADDDHTQYLLASGTRALSGAWNAGQNITAPQFIASAGEYVDAASGVLRLYGDSAVSAFVASTRVLRVGSAQVLIDGVDLALESTFGITHEDASLAGQTLRYNGTRFIPSKLAITDMSATHTHPVSITSATNNNLANRGISEGSGYANQAWIWCNDNNTDPVTGGYWANCVLSDADHTHVVSGNTGAT